MKGITQTHYSKNDYPSSLYFLSGCFAASVLAQSPVERNGLSQATGLSRRRTQLWFSRPMCMCTKPRLHKTKERTGVFFKENLYFVIVFSIKLDYFVLFCLHGNL